MARTRMVTRTLIVTEVTVMTVDVVTQKVANQSFELFGLSYTPEVALKTAKKMYETEVLKLVSVISLTEREECYGMLETEFLKHAKRLDNETRKILETEDID